MHRLISWPQVGGYLNMFESLELFLGSGSICTCVCVQIWGDMVVPKFMALQLWAMVKAWIVFISQPSHPIFSSFEALKSNVEFVFPYFYRVYVVSHKFMLMYAYVSYASKIVPTIYLKIWLDHARPFLGELPDSTGNGQGNGQPNSRKGKGPLPFLEFGWPLKGIPPNSGGPGDRAAVKFRETMGNGWKNWTANSLHMANCPWISWI